MIPRRIRLLPVAVLTAALVLPVEILTAQQPAPFVQPAAAPADLKADLQRFVTALDAVDDYKVRLAALEETRDKNGSCASDAASQSIGDALVWAIDAQRQSEADFVRGKAAIDSCRITIADDAVEGLTQQSAQVADMLKVFAGLPAAEAPPLPALDQMIEQARWVAALKADAPDLTELVHRLDAAKGTAAGDAVSAEATATRVNQLLDISRRADAALRQSMSCVVAPQPLPAVRRIVVIVQSIPQQAKDLSAAVHASKSGSTCAASADTRPVVTGPSWLPPPASAVVRKPAAAMPNWLPDKDTPATQTATTRSADAVGDVREKLIVEEAQRIEDQAKRTADARTQQAQLAVDEQKAREAQTAVLSAQSAQSAQQEQALTQERVLQAQQQRAKGRVSFLGLIGRVTAAVGIVAATGGLGTPLLAALLPAVGALATGGTAGALNAAAALPLSPAAAQAVAVARAAGTTGTLGGLMPGMPAAPAPTPPSRAGAATQSGAASALGDSFKGVWQCTSTTTTVDAAGRQQSGSNQAPISITATGGTPGAGTYSISTQPGANEMVGRLSGGQLVFERSMPGNNGSCQLQLRLQPQASGLIGTTSLTCAQEQMTGTVLCHR